MPARRGACWSEARGPGRQGERAGSHQWSCPQREVHTTTPACLCLAHARSRCAHWRLPTLVSLTHTHPALYTETHRHTPCAHTQDTHPAPTKHCWALPTDSPDNIPVGHRREGRAGPRPPRAPSSCSLGSHPYHQHLPWQRRLETP